MSSYRSEALVRVDYTLRPEDLYASMESPQWRNAARQAAWTTSALVAAMVVGLFATTPWEMASAGSVVIVGFAGWAFRRAFMRVSRPATISPAWEDRMQATLEISESHIRISDPAVTFEREWATLYGAIETDDVFCIYSTVGQYHPVPKRALTPEATALLRQYLDTRVAAMDPRPLEDWMRKNTLHYAFRFAYVALVLAVLFEVVGRWFSEG